MELLPMDFGTSESKDSGKDSAFQEERETAEKISSSSKSTVGAEERSVGNFSSDELSAMDAFFQPEEGMDSSKPGPKDDEPAIAFRDDSILVDSNVNQKIKAEPKGIVKPAKEHNYCAQESGSLGEHGEQLPVIILTRSGAIKWTADLAKFGVVNTKFEHGNLILANDRKGKPLMYFLESGGVLMAFRYLQGGLKVTIPASVDGLDVQYVHHTFFNGGLNPFKGVRFQALKEQFTTEKVLEASKGSLKQSLQGVQEVVLPNGLVMLPPYLFSYCYNLKTLVVPESVRAVSCDTFAKSSFNEIVFNGPCPVGFKLNADISAKVIVKYRHKYANSFVGR